MGIMRCNLAEQCALQQSQSITEHQVLHTAAIHTRIHSRLGTRATTRKGFPGPGAGAVHLRHPCEPGQALHVLGPHPAASHDADAPLRLPHQRCNGRASLPSRTTVR